mmetsp:Transcript_23432/g.47340  ORF Transcript_23432/g.47340 Transcript_23432/m.47340 type:complete len:102 (+) Transcript_23432:42-347(+)
MASRPALGAFRRLMRARELAFKGDTEMLRESRNAARVEFLKNKQVESSAILDELLQGCEEATVMLKHQIVQGVRKGDGEYAMNLDPERHITFDPNKLPGEK